MNRRPSQSRSGCLTLFLRSILHCFRADQPDGDFFDPKPPNLFGRRVLLIITLIVAVLLINVGVISLSVSIA